MPAVSTPPIQQRVDQRRRPSDFSLNFKLGTVAAVAFLTLLVGALGVFLVREFTAASALVSHTQEVQRSVAGVLQRLTDAETGQRGYLLTSAEEFLEPYRGAIDDAKRGVARVGTLVSDNPDQVRLHRALEEAVNSRMLMLDARIEDHRQMLNMSVDQLRAGKQQMDSLRSIVRQMEASEAALLTKRQSDSNRAGLIATAVILPGCLLACILLLVVSNSIRSDVAQREVARLKMEEQNTELETQSQAMAEQQIELEQQLEESQVMTEELESTNRELEEITQFANKERLAAIEARDLVRLSEARYRFMADAIPVQVWTAASDGQLDFVSAGVANYFGRPSDEILSEGWLGVMHPDDISSSVERWTHSLATGEPYEARFRLRGRGGEYRWHLGRAVALRDERGAITEWFGSNTDIDAQQAEAERREKLVRELERTNQELDQFAYVASHDLKAPLRGIGNLSEWIEEDIGPSFPQSAREKMELLRGRVRRLESLIDGILEYSRAGRAKKAPTSIDSVTLVRELIELLAPPAAVVIDVDESLPSLVSERVPLQQVFGNLLVNAVKYAGRPDVQIRVRGVTEGEFVHFSVADNGPGIAPQYHERIFVVFQRLAARDKIEGTGIGLAIVKKIIEGRGGRVWVESPTDSNGTGTTFHFTWRTTPAQEQ